MGCYLPLLQNLFYVIIFMYSDGNDTCKYKDILSIYCYVTSCATWKLERGFFDQWKRWKVEFWPITGHERVLIIVLDMVDMCNVGSEFCDNRLVTRCRNQDNALVTLVPAIPGILQLSWWLHDPRWQWGGCDQSGTLD